MRAVVLLVAPGGGGSGQEAGVAAHDDADIDAGQGAEIEIDAAEGAGDELARRDEAGRVVVLHQVVVDGLRGVHEGHLAAGRFGQDLLGAGRVVAADIDEGIGADLFRPASTVSQ